MIYGEGVSLRATHLSATSFSIVILIVTIFETTLLERHITMIKKGEIGCLLAPSGCGKTTLLRAISGFESIQSGYIS